MKATRTDKHGVAIYPFTVRPDCLWPGCGRIPRTYPESHLCDAHAEEVHRLVTAQQFALRDSTLSARDQAALAELRRRAQEQRARMTPPAPDPIAAAAPEPEPSVIYYVQVMSHIKIGWTSNLEKRMKSYPPNSELLAVHPGTRADEQKLHKRFAAHRSHGREWYPLVPPLLEHIKRMVDQYGKPDAVHFGAQPVQVPMPHRLSQTIQLHARSKGSGFRL